MRSEIKKTLDRINNINPGRPIKIMEVCGTHTMAIAKSGLKQLLPDNIKLISGPGCPVCVTSNEDIDLIIEIIKHHDVELFTFGDMIRVPGTDSSLYHQKTRGKNITICYSPLDALDFAVKNPDKKVIFLAIGFETTAPLTSVLAKRIRETGIENCHIYNTHKLVPPALDALLNDRTVMIDAFLCPGHVSAIIGSSPYEFIPEQYGIPCVIAGFDPMDILEAIQMLLAQLSSGPRVEIQYRSVVKKEGNPEAVKSIYDVFRTADSSWRGIGIIKDSGLDLNTEYSYLDAVNTYEVKKPISREPKGCACGEVLKGIKAPDECKLFEKVCRPDNPIGPCMVSSEGSCAAFFRYERPVR